MTLETALPTADTSATASGQPDADLLDTATQNEGEKQPGEGEGDKAKPAKTAEQLEVERLRKGIDRKTRQREEARAEAQQLRQELSRLREGSGRDTNTAQQDDEPLTLSRAELSEMVKSEAEKLAPTLKQQNAEIEHRKTVIESLAKDLGQERFDALAEDLDEALGGLTDSKGRPKPVTDAVFSADDPKAVIEYLANPDNADEAEVIGRMDPVRAGRAIAKLEAKLEQAKAADKPQRSKAPEPVEAARASGAIRSADPDTSKWTDDQWIKWRSQNRK